MGAVVDAIVSAQLEPHRRRLWGLAYRMTGSAADADELVQETFVRALERPPRDTASPIGNWLTRVAANLSRDRLRARKRRPYVGEWLPAPVAMLDEDDIEPGADARYDLRESASLAFLHALEVLTPKQRAVLILRDVFGYSSREVAEALEMREGAVKVQLHRARAALEPYHAVERPPLAQRGAAIQATLAQLLASLSMGDQQAMTQLLRQDVESISDGGGKYHAALNPIRGAAKVTKFTFGIAGKRGAVPRVVPSTVNGLPALLIEFQDMGGKYAPRAIMTVDVDSSGHVIRWFSMLLDDKIDRVFAHALGS